MDVQVKAGSLVRTIVDREISGMVGEIVSQLESEMTSVVSDLLSAGISAAGMLKLENLLTERTRESARKVLQSNTPQANQEDLSRDLQPVHHQKFWVWTISSRCTSVSMGRCHSSDRGKMEGA